MPFIDGKAPKKPKKISTVTTDDGLMLMWKEPKGKGWKDEAVKYVVYCFKDGEKTNLADASKIVTITTKTYYKLPYKDGKTKYVYVVTALDRMSNESSGEVKKVKL